MLIARRGALLEKSAARITAKSPFPVCSGGPKVFAFLAEQIVSNQFLNGSIFQLDGAVGQSSH